MPTTGITHFVVNVRRIINQDAVAVLLMRVKDGAQEYLCPDEGADEVYRWVQYKAFDALKVTFPIDGSPELVIHSDASQTIRP